MYYVTLLPCVLKTEDMTATANSSIFIFTFTCWKNEGIMNDKPIDTYLRDISTFSYGLSIYTIRKKACSTHVMDDWIESVPTALPNYHWPPIVCTDTCWRRQGLWLLVCMDYFRAHAAWDRIHIHTAVYACLLPRSFQPTKLLHS